MTQALILVGLMFLLIFLGVPICFAFATVAVTGLSLTGSNPLNMIGQGPFRRHEFIYHSGNTVLRVRR